LAYFMAVGMEDRLDKTRNAATVMVFVRGMGGVIVVWRGAHLLVTWAMLMVRITGGLMRASHG